MEPVFALTDTYALMAHGDKEVKEAGLEMAVALDILMDRVGMLMDLEFFDVTSTARVGKIAAGLKNLVVGKMVNREEKDAANDK